MIPFGGNKLCKVKQIKKDYFQVSLDHKLIGYMRRDGSGWMLEEYSREALTAENVQIIGDQIDKLRWQLTQWH